MIYNSVRLTGNTPNLHYEAEPAKHLYSGNCGEAHKFSVWEKDFLSRRGKAIYRYCAFMGQDGDSQWKCTLPTNSKNISVRTRVNLRVKMYCRAAFF